MSRYVDIEGQVNADFTRTRRRKTLHDHSSWGAYACAFGTLLEERYERLDDGSRPEHARLEEVWRLPWSLRDGASTVLPGAGGIHRVGNPYGEAAVSVHLYGPRIGEVDGRDYDPSRDYVCDRLEDWTGEFEGSVGEVKELITSEGGERYGRSQRCEKWTVVNQTR